MALFAWIARLGWRARRDTGEAQGGGADRGSVGRAVLVGLVGYAFYGVQSGSVLGHTMNWMFLASLCVLAAFLCDANRGQWEHAQHRYRNKSLDIGATVRY
jgi:hypothetical protein